MRKAYVVLAMPLLLGGCMGLGMAGMGLAGGGMHGAPGSMPAGGQSLVKESVANGIRMTVNFPPYTLGDSLDYSVTLRDEQSGAAIADASMVLLVSPVEQRAQDPSSGQAGAHAGHGAPPAVAPGGADSPMEFAPSGGTGGRYLFRPSLAAPGAYKFRFVLTRIGTLALNPPNELEHVLQLDRPVDRHTGGGARSAGTSVTPLILLGVGAMALAMLVMVR